MEGRSLYVYDFQTIGMGTFRRSALVSNTFSLQKTFYMLLNPENPKNHCCEKIRIRLFQYLPVL